MIQGLLVITLVVAVLAGIRWLKQQPKAAKRKALLRSFAGAGIFLMLTLALTGRMHWLIALIGALLPFLRGALGVGIQLLPLWLRRKSGQSHTDSAQQRATSRSATDITLEEALNTLGLTGNIDAGEITVTMVNDAHRRLIQKVHPDRGGNDYLASRVNQARDVLLARIERQQ